MVALGNCQGEVGAARPRSNVGVKSTVHVSWDISPYLLPTHGYREMLDEANSKRLVAAKTDQRLKSTTFLGNWKIP